jgi:ABC-2 type transport system permease protein
MLSLATAFFLRDARIQMSYRISFLAQLAGNVMIIGLFYFIGKMVGDKPLPALEAYGGSFLAFLLIGIALTDCVGVSLFSFASQIREGQTTGTLEASLMSPIHLSTLLILSSLWSYFMSGVRFVLYLLLGAVLYGADLSGANIPAAMVVFVLTVLSFMGIGILWAGVLLIIKRGESVLTLAGTLVMLTSGVLFPVSALPGWVQVLAQAIPLTHALEGMRRALLKGAGLTQLADSILPLSCFAAIFLVLGIMAFSWAVEYTKRTGSLTQY